MTERDRPPEQPSTRESGVPARSERDHPPEQPSTRESGVPARSERDHPKDELPAELDVGAYVGPYLFPDIKRRRIAGALLGVIGVASLVGGLLGSNGGLVVAGAFLAAAAVYHFVAGWHSAVDQTEALAAASRAVGFPVGHASAQLGWRGLRSRPSWRILVYSADEPPTMRGLVEIDGVDASVLGEYTEPNPEDWSAFGLAAESDVPGPGA